MSMHKALYYILLYILFQYYILFQDSERQGSSGFTGQDKASRCSCMLPVLQLGRVLRSAGPLKLCYLSYDGPGKGPIRLTGGMVSLASSQCSNILVGCLQGEPLLLMCPTLPMPSQLLPLGLHTQSTTWLKRAAVQLWLSVSKPWHVRTTGQRERKYQKHHWYLMW
jgi:hypothetical protein